MIDKNKCYMDDVYKDFTFDPKTYVNARNVKDRKINGKIYKDPDAYSDELYKDQEILFNNKKLPNGEIFNISKENKILKSKNDVRYSCDFIGPSFTGAYVKLQKNVTKEEKEIKDKELGQILKECRKIGGHIIWPVDNSINRAKTFVNDRIDVTLEELKDYYENPDGEAKYCEALRKAFKANEKYLEKFKTSKDSKDGFSKFAEFFMLEGSFVDNGKVVMFGPIYTIEEARNNSKYDGSIRDLYRPDNYLDFMEKNMNAIKKRTNLIIEKLTNISENIIK